MMPARQNGFTLLEMAVVIIIIGLIIGGLLTVHSLVRTSQLQSMLAENDSFTKSIQEFQDKFLALPGDMKNAESMWGTDPGGCPAASNTVVKIATCNGNGDGKIGDSDLSATLSNTREWYRAWQQLYDAGFLKTKFTGVPGPGGVSESVPDVNVPRSAVEGAGWTLMYLLLNSDGALWSDTYGHILAFGGYTSGSYTLAPVLKPSEAFAIDQKVDDGKPGRGRIRAWRTSVLPTCTITDTTQDANAYNATADNAKGCSLVFMLGF